MYRNLFAGLFLMLGTALFGAGGAQVLDHKMQDIKGKDVNLADYKGDVLMIVNVASKCGLTPQYNQLVDIHQKYKDKGFRILGFPANNFGKQEPGTNEEIATFCVKEFNVDFDMFSKISVKGDDQAPLYGELTSKEDNGEFGGEIRWNFTKFLVGKDGRVIARFGPRTKPDAPDVVAAIEKALAD
ncbi:MAG: glutathione peroxidase [Acidobacteriota bacterium]|nr:glutathione peroxidase [Acidobacteriota bacterium]